MLQQRAGFAAFKNAFDDAAGLIGFVAHGDKLRLLPRGSLSPQVLGKALRRQSNHRVRCRKNRLRRAVIPVQRYNARGRRELSWIIEDVAYCRGAKRVNGLRIVADDRHAVAVRL